MATKDDIIADLRRLVDRQAKQIAALVDRVSNLELQLAKALKNSSNSSKSPSSDIVKPPKKQAKGSEEIQTGRAKRARAKTARVATT